jgi:hypothetical protein
MIFNYVKFEVAPSSFVAVCWIRDPRYEIRDPGWIKFRIRDPG